MPKKYDNEAPRALAPDLWELRGSWSNALGRRMTVVRLGRELAVHNPFELDDSETRWLDSLGEVRWIIAPNKFHGSDGPWMAKRYPNARLFAPASMHASLREQGLSPLHVNAEFPALPGLRCLPMLGTRIEEAAFLHEPSRTLILTDLAFHMRADQFTGLERAFMRWNKIGVRFGPTKLTRLLFTRNKSELVGSYERLLALDFDRVVVNHGDVLESGGKEQLRSSVAEIFG